MGRCEERWRPLTLGLAPGGAWDSIEQVRGWKGSSEFRERMARVLQHVDSFEPLELELVATADGGSTQRAANGVHQV